MQTLSYDRMMVFQHPTDKSGHDRRQKKLGFFFPQTSKVYLYRVLPPKSVVFILVLLLFFQDLFAQTIDLKSLSKNFEKTAALSGQFRQENFDLLQDRKTEASGLFFFMRPGLMRWIYEQPDPYSIIVGKEQIWLYDPILENVTIYKIQNINGIRIIAFFLEPEKLQQHFKVIKPLKVLLDSIPGDKRLFLTHKKQNRNMSEVQLAFDTNYRIKQFVIVDSNQNYRKISLSQTDVSPQMNRADFEFIIPAGVEIIDKTNEKP